jgi:hypothetical protein
LYCAFATQEHLTAVGFGLSFWLQQSDGPFHRNTVGEDLQFPFGNCQFSESTLETHPDFGEDPHDRLVEALDRERNAILRKALAETIVANLSLLVLTACLFGLVRYHRQALKEEATQSKQELAARDLQLEKLMSALSNQAGSQTYAIKANASLLLENYGGFLPRQGHEYAEQIKEASAQMEQLRLDLVGSPNSNGDEAAA